MALIVFLRGLNVGGHRRFRPSVLATELAAYDVVNIGAAGTFVVRRPGSTTKFVAELRRKLPFETVVAVSDAEDLFQLELEQPFGSEPLPDGVVPFVSMLSKECRTNPALPISVPSEEDWFVRILGSRNRLIFGVYRRNMKTIGYLGQIDELFGSPATTRSWRTILLALRILKT